MVPKAILSLNKTCNETQMQQIENQKSISIKNMGRNGYGPKWYGPKWLWTEMVMGRNGYGPK